MGGTIQVGDLQRVLSLYLPSITSTVAATPVPTTTTATLTLAGGVTLADGSAVGATLVVGGAVTRITANTGNAVTFSALASAPAAGVAANIFGIGSVEAGIFSQSMVDLTAVSNQAANTDFADFTAPFEGKARLFLSLPTASVVNLMVTPSSGTEGNAGAFNGGVAIPAAEPQSFTWGVTPGAIYALQCVTAQTGTSYFSVTVGRP